MSDSSFVNASLSLAVKISFFSMEIHALLIVIVGSLDVLVVMHQMTLSSILLLFLLYLIEAKLANCEFILVECVMCM